MTTMFPTDHDVAELTEWRHRLHTMPELSGHEQQTAGEVARLLASTTPDRLITGLGGHGVAAVYEGAEPGHTVLFRAELDGLPIAEISSLAYRSATDGRGHLCGHDGHMATLAALARGLGRKRPRRGRAVLLFQPAEENGAGAAAVIADPKFAAIRPDFAFAMHNMPGVALGTAELMAGPVNCASRGMRIVLSGKTAHASTPGFGVSPMAAMARLMPALAALGAGSVIGPDFAMATVTHARLGEAAFGVAPGHGEIWVTLRSLTDARMQLLCAEAEALAREAAARSALGIAISYEDVFAHCENAPEATAVLGRALDAEGVPYGPGNLPMRASEDFGRFGQIALAAMFFPGAGVNHPSLHNPDYDFPDELIGLGAGVFMRVVRELLG